MNLANMMGHIKTLLYYRFVFASIAPNALLMKPLKIDCPKAITIGKSVYIGHYSWLMGGKDKGKVTLCIGNGVQIGHFSHLVAMKHIVIEDDVLLADKVFISDCTHQYDQIAIPVQKQNIQFLKAVTIGEGSWLGENVSVCGANIGKHCVIGANSVVTRDIPDYCVAVGSPARIIKRYDFEADRWVSL